MSVLFSVGAFCFLVAAVAAQWESSPRGAIGVTFFVGSIFFTSAAYLQYSETVNVDHDAHRGLETGAVAPRLLGATPDRLGGLVACSSSGPCSSTSARSRR